MPQTPTRQEIELPRPELIAAAAGLLYYLGFPPLGCWPLSVAGASLLAGALASSRSLKQALTVAALMKIIAILPTGAYLTGLGLLVWVVGAVIYLLPWALAVAGGSWLARRLGGEAAGLLVIPGLWTLGEWYGTSFHFLPSHLTAWSEALASPGLLVVRYTGVWGVATLAAFAAVLPWLAVVAARSAEPRRRAALAATALLSAGLLIPPFLARLASPSPARPGGEPLAAAVASLEAGEAMESYLARGAGTPDGAAAVELYLKKRAAAIADLLGGARPDLYVIPEDAINVILSRSRSEQAYRAFGIENNGALLDAFQRLARERGFAWALGLTTVRGGNRYNSTLLVDAKGGLAGLRDKWRLTPGSEYWPLSRWLPLWLLFGGEQYVDAAKPYAPARTPFPLMSFKGWRLGTLVCLEGHMPAMYRGWRRASADLVLFMANANWFHREPGAFNRQVLNVVRLSAAAYGLPVLLTGKASYAGYVDEFGGFQIWPWASSPEEEAAHLVTVARPAPGLTVPARFGEYYLVLSAVLVPLMVLIARVMGGLKTGVQSQKPQSAA